LENVLSKFSDFVTDAIRAMERGVGLKDPSILCDLDLQEAEEKLMKKDVVLG
jgi:hypothetical protein